MSMSVTNDLLVVDPIQEYNGQALLLIRNINNEEVHRQYGESTAGFVVNIRDLPDGRYYFNIYVSHGSSYWARFSRQCPGFVKEREHARFSTFPFAFYNRLQMQSWPTDKAFLSRQLVPTRQYQSDNRTIMDYARSIAKGHLFTNTKILAVHDFVARNVAYDTDALKSNRYLFCDCSALATLRLRRSVCQGYTNLSIALLRALGIPAMEVPCYALGQGARGGWELETNRMAVSANHVLTAAFTGRRWSVMDVTWDSDLEFVDGREREKTGCGISHCYFDMTPSMLSLSHKIIP